MKKALVLLSAGLDSTINLLLARRDYEIAAVLTFDYGQKAKRQEIDRARRICATHGFPHHVIALPWLGEISQSTLNRSEKPIPTGSSVQIDDHARSAITAKAVWVPNRNGVFLNVAAAFAEANGIEVVIPGFNREEATTFPDNSEAYLAAAERSLSFSTQFPQVKLKCYTIKMDKTEIVQMGRELGAPFDLMWPCYFDKEELCRSCESCQRFFRAVGELEVLK